MAVIADISATPKPGPYPKGRRCTHSANGVRCITLLCTYDQGPECFRHAKPSTASLHEQRTSLEDLMSEAA